MELSVPHTRTLGDAQGSGSLKLRGQPSQLMNPLPSPLSSATTGTLRRVAARRRLYLSVRRHFR